MNVQFNEPEYAAAPAALASNKRGPLMGFIIGQKWAKDEAGAQRILLYILIVVVAVTGMILVSGLNFSSPPPPIIPATPGAGAP